MKQKCREMDALAVSVNPYQTAPEISRLIKIFIVCLFQLHCIKISLKCMGIAPYFSALFTKRNNFHYIMFASLNDVTPSKMESTPNR